MTPITKNITLKKLKAIYWRAFYSNKWHIALQVLELQGKNSGLFEKQSLPKVAPIADMTEEQCRDTLKELDPKFKHPPPPYG